MERWLLRGNRTPPTSLVGELHARVATPVDVRWRHAGHRDQPGRAGRQAEDRAAFLAAIGLVAPGNGLVILDATESGPRPRRKRLADAIAARRWRGPRLQVAARGRAGRLDRGRGTRARPAASEPGAAKALADRVGGFVREADVERRYQTPDRLDGAGQARPLSRRRPDRRPTTSRRSSRRPCRARSGRSPTPSRATGARALGLLDRLLDDTPEPVLLAVLHRRVRELIEPGTGSRAASGCRPRQGDGDRQRLPVQNARATGRALDEAELIGRARRTGRARCDGQGRAGLRSDRSAATASRSACGSDRITPASRTGAGDQIAAGRRAQSGGTDQACSCTTRSLSMAKTHRPSPRSRSSIRSGSMYSCEQSSHRPPGIPKHRRSLRSGSRNVVSNRVVMSRRLQAGHRSRTEDMPGCTERGLHRST